MFNVINSDQEKYHFLNMCKLYSTYTQAHLHMPTFLLSLLLYWYIGCKYSSCGMFSDKESYLLVPIQSYFMPNLLNCVTTFPLYPPKVVMKS